MRQSVIVGRKISGIFEYAENEEGLGLTLLILLMEQRRIKTVSHAHLYTVVITSKLRRLYYAINEASW